LSEFVTADALVIGAGCAGLAAAAKLADAGAKVVVVEQAPRLGGRATTFVDRESGERVDNGQHVLFGCYRDTYELLRLIGTAQLAPLQRSLAVTIVRDESAPSALVCPDLPSPLHLLLGLALWSGVPIGARLSARHLAPLLRDARRVGAEAAAATVDPQLTVSQWLTRLHQAPELRHMLWDPLVFAALNQSPDQAAARPFARVLAEMFGPRVEDSSIGLPLVPLDELIAVPAAAFVEARGGTVMMRRPAKIETSGDRIKHVHVGDVVIRTATVISAVPWHTLGMLWSEAPPPCLTEIMANAAQMKSSPIVTVNLWFDREVMPPDLPFVGLAGRTWHWFFSRAAILGGVSGATHISAVASGAVDILRLENAELIALALDDARVALPRSREAQLTRAVVVREPRATFSLEPGSPPRPSTATPLKGFYLAGDWTDTGLPATIESAVRSGFAAAAACRFSPN
jgi:squalene-associated FAD-dependent desaturase